MTLREAVRAFHFIPHLPYIQIRNRLRNKQNMYNIIFVKHKLTLPMNCVRKNNNN